VLKETSSLRLDQLCHHVTEDSSDGVESLVCCTNVVETVVVEEDLLHNEDGDCLAKLGASLHDAQAQRDDFRREQEVDDLGRIVLDEGADDAQARQAEVLERTRLGRRVEEGVEEEGDMGCRGFVSIYETSNLADRGWPYR
jgi:hypothetical protein